jgi:flagellar biosynthesis protein FliQ
LVLLVVVVLMQLHKIPVVVVMVDMVQAVAVAQDQTMDLLPDVVAMVVMVYVL